MLMESFEKVKEWLELGRIYNVASSFNLFWNTKNIKVNLNLVVFIHEVIYLKQRVRLIGWIYLETHWMALYVSGNYVTYFESFGVAGVFPSIFCYHYLVVKTESSNEFQNSIIHLLSLQISIPLQSLKFCS